MEGNTGFLSQLQTAYAQAFLNPDANILTPDVIGVVVVIGVAFGMLYELKLEPAWVKRYIMKYDVFPGQDKFLWFRLGTMGMIFLGTALTMLLVNWPL